ncbi:hypothetical protein [Nesterenkonia sp. K-15-9-6]|uniref:hypothetical protein n=1 Tax=Nesterenkonia sp. K-15-9-6 TaxID=3093918 RepID=UPI00404512B0
MARTAEKQLESPYGAYRVRLSEDHGSINVICGGHDEAEIVGRVRATADGFRGIVRKHPHHPMSLDRSDEEVLNETYVGPEKAAEAVAERDADRRHNVARLLAWAEGVDVSGVMFGQLSPGAARIAAKRQGAERQQQEAKNHGDK